MPVAKPSDVPSGVKRPDNIFLPERAEIRQDPLMSDIRDIYPLDLALDPEGRTGGLHATEERNTRCPACKPVKHPRECRRLSG